MYSASIQKLIKLFSQFPTVGPRTAARFVFYLLKLKKEEIEELLNSISEFKERVKLCSFCFKPFEGEKNLCDTCSDSKRDKTLLCVVEKETDLETIEKTKKFKGLYFILGGTVSKFKKPTVHTQEDKQNLRAEELVEKVKGSEIKEIILAMNSTPEGEGTRLYLERLLKSLNKKITRLGRGLPVGAELEYADEETLSSALEGRKQTTDS